MSLSEESVRVTFRGEVYPAAKDGFDAIPFTDTIVIPIPKVPIVALSGIEGVPLTDSFVVTFSVKNTNTFPFSVDTIQTFLELNQSRYSLLHTEQSTEMQPGESGIVILRMENAKGKALGMALNLAQSSDRRFAVDRDHPVRHALWRVHIPDTARGNTEIGPNRAPPWCADVARGPSRLLAGQRSLVPRARTALVLRTDSCGSRRQVPQSNARTDKVYDLGLE